MERELAVMPGGDYVQYDYRRNQEGDERQAYPLSPFSIMDGERLRQSGHRCGTFGALDLAHEPHRDLLAIDLEERGITPQERHQVKLIRNEAVVTALDHLQVMRRDMAFGGDLRARQSPALARRG